MKPDNGNPFRSDEMYETADLVRILKVSRVSINTWEKSGRIPKSVPLSTGKRWPGRHMVAWYDGQVKCGA